MPATYQPQGRRRLMVEACGGLICLASAALLEGLPRQVCLMFAGAFVGLAISSLFQMELGPVFGLLKKILIIVCVGGCLYFGVDFVLRRTHEFSAYPRSDGVLADFQTGGGGPAWTAQRQHFSMFSDNTWNQSSKIWFRRIADPIRTGEGFLRLYFDLTATAPFDPYVGIFADLDYPPPRSYDLSGFSSISLRIRCGQSLLEAPITVGLILYPANIENPDFAYPTQYIPSSDLTSEWILVDLPFPKFAAPRSYSGPPIVMDPRQIYRFGLIIIGYPGSSCHGQIDVDDITLER